MPLVEAKAVNGWIEAWWNNADWEDIYVQMIWLCYIQAWGRLVFFNDNGEYFYRCYGGFTQKLEFWS